MPDFRRWAWPGAALVGILLAGSLPLAADNPANDPRVREVGRQLTCYCGCNTQSIASCTCGVAQRSREEILASLESGQSTDEVVHAWVERYGPRILLEPPREGFNLVGWFLPAVTLGVAGLLLLVVLRRWNRRPPATTMTNGDATPDPRYVEQLERELEKLNP